MRLAFFPLALLACSAPRSPSPSTDAGSDAGVAHVHAAHPTEVAKTAERGWAHWLRREREAALGDFGTVIAGVRTEYPRLDLVGPGLPPVHQIANGTSFGVLATDKALLCFRIADQAAVAWREYAREAGSMLSVRGDDDVLVQHAGTLEVLSLPALGTLASFESGAPWAAVTSAADGSFFAYETETSTEGVRLVDRATRLQRWSVPSGPNHEIVSAIAVAPDAATLLAFTAVLTPRGPHYQEVVLLRAADGHVVYRSSVAAKAGPGPIAPAEPTPPARFVSGGAAVDYRDPNTTRTLRVDTRSGKASPSPAPLAWNDAPPEPAEIKLPPELVAQLCHAGNIVLPAEACVR